MLDAHSPRSCGRIVEEPPRGHRRRVPDHRHRVPEGLGTSHRRALRHCGAGRRPGASTASGSGACAGGARVGWRVTEWTAASHLTSRARTRLRRGHRGRTRRQRFVPAPARHAARCLDGHDRFGADAGLERPPRRLGRRRRRRRPRGPLRRPAVGPAQPAVSGPRRLARSRTSTERAGARRARRHGAVALRRRGQRRRPGPGARHQRAAASVRQRRARADSPRPGRVSFRGPLQGG